MDSKKIIWSKNSLEELKRLLGAEPQEVEEAIQESDLEFPWPITIESISVTPDVNGLAWATATVSFDKIDDATSYEVRFSPVIETPSADYPYSIYALNIDQGSTNVHYRDLSEAVQANEYGFIATFGTSTSVSGGYSAWTRLYNGSDLDLWMGTGLSTDTSPAISHPILPATAHGKVIAVFRNINGTPYIKNIATSTITYTSIPITYTSPSLTADAGDIVITMIRTTSSSYPDDPSLWVDNGFTGEKALSYITGIYANGTAISAGIASGGTVNTEFAIYPPGDSTARVGGYTVIIGVA